MYDFSCVNPSDMYYAVLADRARYFKEDEEGISAMCKAIEEMRLEERRMKLENLSDGGNPCIVYNPDLTHLAQVR